MKVTSEKGFTLTEALTGVVLMLVLGAVAIPIVDGAVQNSRLENALQTVAMELRYARQLAMDHRRVHRVTFTTPRTITIERVESGSTVQISQTQLHPKTEFNRNGTSGDPDNLGFSSSGPVDFNGSTSVDFNPDGSGEENGVVFVAIPSELADSRAATLFGTTGRVRGYRYVKSGGSWGWQ